MLGYNHSPPYLGLVCVMMVEVKGNGLHPRSKRGDESNYILAYEHSPYTPTIITHPRPN